MLNCGSPQSAADRAKLTFLGAALLIGLNIALFTNMMQYMWRRGKEHNKAVAANINNSLLVAYANNHTKRKNNCSEEALQLYSKKLPGMVEPESMKNPVRNPVICLFVSLCLLLIDDIYTCGYEMDLSACRCGKMVEVTAPNGQRYKECSTVGITCYLANFFGVVLMLAACAWFLLQIQSQCVTNFRGMLGKATQEAMAAAPPSSISSIVLEDGGGKHTNYGTNGNYGSDYGTANNTRGKATATATARNYEELEHEHPRVTSYTGGGLINTNAFKHLSNPQEDKRGSAARMAM